MSKEDKFLQFPLCVLALPDEDLCETIIRYSAVENGAEICGIQAESVKEGAIKSHAKTQKHITQWTKRHGPDPLVRISTHICFEARDGGIRVREFRVLCAIYSSIGRNPYRAVTETVIRMRAIGCKGRAVMESENGSLPPMLTEKQTRWTVATLHRLKFFARVTPSRHGRKTFFSHRLTDSAIRQKLAVIVAIKKKSADYNSDDSEKGDYNSNDNKKGDVKGDVKGDYDKNAFNKNTLNKNVVPPLPSSAEATPQFVIPEMADKVIKPKGEIGWGMKPNTKWLTQAQMNKLGADNPHLILEYAKNRYPVISVGGLVSRIEP